MRVARVLAAVVVLVGVTGAAAPSGAAPPGRDPRPGAAGIGDPYFPGDGNGGYDVGHYDLAVDYDPATDRLAGVATITAEATASLSSFNLDLVGLDVRSVEVHRGRRAAGRPAPAAWSRDGQELTITPADPIYLGRPFVVVVRYDGVPEPIVEDVGGFLGTYGFLPTDDGAVVVGQPDVAATWFPVNDHPLDKATYTFRVTVPDGYEVVANGLPVGETSAGGRTTSVWEARDPMASYLTTLGIGQWDIRTGETADGLPIVDAVDPDLGTLADSSLARQGEILEWLEGYLGDYPFETVGAIVDDDQRIPFALETQTRAFYVPYFFEAGLGDVTVVHELAHQWYGDHVALARWSDIWLNEGFATYFEYLWNEREGIVGADEDLRGLYSAIPADDPFWAVPIGDPGPDRLFDVAVYYRGAMAVHALRLAVGDEAFFEIVRAWPEERGGGHGTTADFLALAEDVSGAELDPLFDTWLFTPAKPPSFG